MPKPRPEWSFENSIGDIITTHDAETAYRYRNDTDHFTEVTETPVPYARRLKADLVAEVGTRNIGRADDALIPDTGTVADLAAALGADDANGGGDGNPT